MKYTLVIPALNEIENLPNTIKRAQIAFRDTEIWIVDGGSQDGTVEWVQERENTLLRLLRSPVRGRGPQMNLGAKEAYGDVLLFLHADCLLPEDAATQIDKVLSDVTVCAGCFSVQFAEKRPVSLHLTSALINLHSRLTKSATGDQGIFVRRSDFFAINGYKPWPLFEDIDLVERIRRKRGRFVVANAFLTVSARRWLAGGVIPTSLWMVALWIGYRLGVPPTVLKRWYQDVRSGPNR